MSDKRRLLQVRLAEAGGNEAQATDLPLESLEAVVEAAETRNTLIRTLVRLEGQAEEARCAGMTLDGLRARLRLFTTGRQLEAITGTELRRRERLETWQPVGPPS